MSDDTIYRQAAIDVMLMAIDDDWEPDYATDRMNELPSAQPDVTDTNVGDMISRQAAIDAPEKFIKDCNPEHFVGHQKFIEFMDDAEIGSFGNWQFANGFNMGLTAAEVAIEKLPSAQAERRYDEWCTDCKEYDQEKHCCPRWNRVILTTLQDAQRTGRWTIEDCHATTYKYCCSNCKAHHRARYDFCPSCGAEMEAEE